VTSGIVSEVMSVIGKRSLLAKQYEQNAKDCIREAEGTDDPQWRNGRASGWNRPCAKPPVSGLMILPSSNASFFSSDLYLLSIELIEAAENDLPRSFMIPRVELYASHEVQWMMRA
jgi:hypothetical protein